MMEMPVSVTYYHLSVYFSIVFITTTRLKWLWFFIIIVTISSSNGSKNGSSCCRNKAASTTAAIALVLVATLSYCQYSAGTSITTIFTLITISISTTTTTTVIITNVFITIIIIIFIIASSITSSSMIEGGSKCIGLHAQQPCITLKATIIFVCLRFLFRSNITLHPSAQMYLHINSIWTDLRGNSQQTFKTNDFMIRKVAFLFVFVCAVVVASLLILFFEVFILYTIFSLSLLVFLFLFYYIGFAFFLLWNQ